MRCARPSLVHKAALRARAVASRSMLWMCAEGKCERKQSDVRGKGPEPRKAMEVGGEARKAFRREASRRERSV